LDDNLTPHSQYPYEEHMAQFGVLATEKTSSAIIAVSSNSGFSGVACHTHSV